VLFCSVTALGLLRLVCQPKLMGTAVKSAAESAPMKLTPACRSC
jgi:hypothetical protein